MNALRLATQGMRLLFVCAVLCCGRSAALPAVYIPEYMRTDAGESRMWLACSPDGVTSWHRVQRMTAPTSVYGAFADPSCVVLRWEIER